MYGKIGTFYLRKDSLEAMAYLKKKNINLSNIVRRALIREMERQKLFNKQFPED